MSSNTYCDHRIEPVDDGLYRNHEIVINYCDTCKHWLIDARSDDHDGEYIAGYITKSLYDGIEKAKAAIDKHCFEMSLLINVPF